MIPETDNEGYKAVDIIPSVFTFACVYDLEKFKRSKCATSALCFCTDGDLLYEAFYSDFGPLNLGLAFQHFTRTTQLLQEAGDLGVPLCYYAGPGGNYMANAAVLVGMFLVLGLDQSGEQAWQCLSSLAPFCPFRDASCGPSLFHLSVQHCLMGVAKARASGFLSWKRLDSAAEAAEYSHYERVENGDMTWILPGKLLAFSGPNATARVFRHFTTKTPEDYWQYFRSKGISTVVRLNNEVYAAKQFRDGGFDVKEMYFPDGTCPSEVILQAFLHLAETERGALAVHCKAGLGRTGILICSYLIKHYGFSAEEAIGYIRIARPGSVIASQQIWLVRQQGRLLQEGVAYRSIHKVAPPRLPLWPSPELLASIPKQAPATIAISEVAISAITKSPNAVSAVAVSAVAVRISGEGEESLPPSTQASAQASRRTSADVDVAAGSCGEAVAMCSSTQSDFVGKLGLLGQFLRLGGPRLRSMDRRSCEGAPASQPLLLPAAGKPAAAASRARSVALGVSSSFKARTAAAVGVARALAPNGQPRKIPAALLGVSGAELRAFAADEETSASGSQDWTIGVGPSLVK